MLNRLMRDARGATLPIMVAALFPVLGAVGSGVDIGRLYMVKSQLQAGVDAAALAGAKSFAVEDKTGHDPKSRDNQIEAYFEGNFPANYLGSEDVTLSPAGAPPRFQQRNGVNVTTVTAQATVPMSFMRIFGAEARVITATAQAEVQPRPLEVMVVLDNTGSMKDYLPKDSAGVVKTRMAALKLAAKSFINILFQGGDTRKELALGFVMYDVTVNVGNILKDAGVAIQQLAGFNAGFDYYDQSRSEWTYVPAPQWPANPLGWKGCVMADASVKSMSSNLAVQDAGAWDITRTLPGEDGHPAVSPYYVPPMYVPKLKAGEASKVGGPNRASAIEMANPGGDFYTPESSKKIEPNNNLFLLDGSDFTTRTGKALANTPMYREAFLNYFIGLNTDPLANGDDVIVKNDKLGSFYDPDKDKDNDFRVEYSRIPQKGNWSLPTVYNVNKNGGMNSNKGDRDTTPWPSPNWQCPSESVTVAYGRTKAFYNKVIDDDNGAIYPANGTLHHAGLLWGYRLLVRSDRFTRENPTNEEPRRALVFMTDGETALGEAQNGYTNRTFTWHGNFDDSAISAKAGDLEPKSELRFSKTCAALQREKNSKGDNNAPKVYIIVLGPSTPGTLSTFEKCAPNRVYKTADTAQLKAAFDDVAAELVDLHLVQ